MGKGNMVEADQLLSVQYVEQVLVPTPGREGLKHLVMMEWREMHIYRVVGGKIVVSKCPV